MKSEKRTYLLMVCNQLSTNFLLSTNRNHLTPQRASSTNSDIIHYIKNETFEVNTGLFFSTAHVQQTN